MKPQRTNYIHPVSSLPVFQYEAQEGQSKASDGQSKAIEGQSEATESQSEQNHLKASLRPLKASLRLLKGSGRPFKASLRPLRACPGGRGWGHGTHKICPMWFYRSSAPPGPLHKKEMKLF